MQQNEEVESRSAGNNDTWIPWHLRDASYNSPKVPSLCLVKSLRPCREILSPVSATVLIWRRWNLGEVNCRSWLKLVNTQTTTLNNLSERRWSMLSAENLFSVFVSCVTRIQLITLIMFSKGTLLGFLVQADATVILKKADIIYQGTKAARKKVVCRRGLWIQWRRSKLSMLVSNCQRQSSITKGKLYLQIR